MPFSAPAGTYSYIVMACIVYALLGTGRYLLVYSYGLNSYGLLGSGRYLNTVYIGHRRRYMCIKMCADMYVDMRM